MRLSPKRGGVRGSLNPLQITSMIDVIFLLLLYFILTTTHVPPESVIAAALRSESASRPTTLAPQVIEVGLFDGSAGFRVGSRVARDRRSLTAVLRELPTQAGVIIKGSGGAEVQQAAEALQAARDAGFAKVTYVPTP